MKIINRIVCYFAHTHTHTHKHTHTHTHTHTHAPEGPTLTRFIKPLAWEQNSVQRQWRVRLSKANDGLTDSMTVSVTDSMTDERALRRTCVPIDGWLTKGWACGRTWGNRRMRMRAEVGLQAYERASGCGSTGRWVCGQTLFLLVVVHVFLAFFSKSGLQF